MFVYDFITLFIFLYFSISYSYMVFMSLFHICVHFHLCSSMFLSFIFVLYVSIFLHIAQHVSIFGYEPVSTHETCSTVLALCNVST